MEQFNNDFPNYLLHLRKPFSLFNWYIPLTKKKSPRDYTLNLMDVMSCTSIKKATLTDTNCVISSICVLQVSCAMK